MIDVVELAPAPPLERGRRLGDVRAAEIRRTLDAYRELFTAIAGEPVELGDLGEEAHAATAEWAPELAREIEGIADGAGLPVADVAALNARTEVLAVLGARGRGECSTVVVLDGPGDGPVAMQNWDWHEHLRDGMHVLQVDHGDGRVVRTLTEYGIVGKLGVSSRGVGLLLNILHHDADGRRMGVPVHVIARRVLDEARDLSEATEILCSARASASSAMTLVGVEGAACAAVAAEVFPGGPRFVLPGSDGVLLHTNHFLASEAALGERERLFAPDSYVRLGVLQRAVRGSSDRADVLRALGSSFGGGGAICCRPRQGAVLGDRWATLATIELDVPAGRLTVHRDGPPATDAESATTRVPDLVPR
jgi:isopenicillin-N N-acyltransferase-like protein